jgi:hypothetical protein
VEWLTKVGMMMQEHVAYQKRHCCMCGSEADKAPDSCSLRCVCAWQSAHDLWQDNRGSLSDKDLMWIERTFLEAHETEPDNELLLADYALFLWHEVGKAQEAEHLLEKAIALPPSSTRVRMRVLNLYSHFLSTTPITDTKLNAHREGSYMGDTPPPS